MANRNNVPSPVLPLPPLEYDVQYMNTLIRLLNYFIQQQDNPGQIRGSDLHLSGLPTTATGLVSGDVWNNAGTLKIIP
jgi:hypothetical protein